MTDAKDHLLIAHATHMHSIRRFVLDMWGLIPQPVKPEYAERWAAVEASTGAEWERLKKTVSGDWFGYPVNPERRDLDWVWYGKEGPIHDRQEFIRRGFYTWQQNLILMGIEKAVAGGAKRLLSVVSGHGIGKSATCSWVILWFLYCFLEAQVPVTAPTSNQMHDVLWKELSIWIKRVKSEDIRHLYEWTSDYVRIAYSPESWFARARTSTKENTEAIAGVHSEHVCIVVDEASGVPQQVFDTAEGALTGGNTFVLLISNGTDTIGYFYDSHHKNKSEWQNFSFNGEESPIVDRAFIALKYRHGPESETYKIRVKGGFPGDSMMDGSGYLQLMHDSRIIIRPKTGIDIPFLGRKILGIDPSGEGKDLTTFWLRDRFKATCIETMQRSNDKEIAERVLTFIDRYQLDPADVVIGAFGCGADVAKEVAIASARSKGGPYEIYSVMEGNSPQDEEEYNWKFFQRLPDEIDNPYPSDVRKDNIRPEDVQKSTAVDMYLNIRALMYFRAAKLLNSGVQIVDTSVDNSNFKNEMSVIRYKRTLHGNRIQLMSKKEMLKLGIQSPNHADAFALTTLRLLDLDIPVRRSDDEKDEDTMSSEERHSAL